MDKQRSQHFMLKLVGDTATALAAALVCVGDRAGLFKAMAGAGPLTIAALAEKSAVAPRYVEEWLAAMVGAGYVEHDAAGTYTLPQEHAMFLADPASEYYLGGLFVGLPELFELVPRLASAFASGTGIPFAEFGAAMPHALKQMNRRVYEHRLVRWLQALPVVTERLAAGGCAIDVGCGTGIVPITLAKAYPQAHIAGLDFDARSIAIARANAAEAGVPERINFIVAGAEAMPIEPKWDFISSFDVIHDLPDPRAALGRIRAALAADGTYLMVEPKVAETLDENCGNPFARMLYGYSCLHCVPQSLAQGGPGLGACWGESRARAWRSRRGSRASSGSMSRVR